MKTLFKTREEWLSEAYRLFSPRMTQHGKLPKTVNIIISWPHGTKKAIGECYPETCTKDKSTYITVSPALGNDIVQVLATLLHEMIHAIDIKNHGKDFKKVALALGLTGKMRSTVAGEELAKELVEMAKTLGEFPHTVLNYRKHKKDPKSPKGPLTLVSPVDPTYTAYVSRKTYAERGGPLCPFSKKPMVPKDPKEAEEFEDAE